MKQIDFFKKTLLLVAVLLGGGTMHAIDIPQTLGNYIVIGDGSTNPKTTAAGVTLTKCAVDGSSATSYTVGSTGAQTEISFALTATSAGNYLFSFMSGSNGYTAKLSLSLKNSSNTEVWSGNADIINNSTWTLTSLHRYDIGSLTAGDYTMTIKVTERAQDGGTGNYAGNFGNFCFYTSTQLPWPSSSAMDLQYGTFNNATWNSDGVINYIKASGASIDNLIAYNSSESCYDFNFNISYIKQNAIVGITVIDIETGNVEANQSLPVTANGDKTIHLGKKLTIGWKKIRFDFSDDDTSNDDAHLFNFQTVTLPSATYNALPLMSNSTTYLDLSQWPTSGNPRYQSGDENLGYIYHGNTAYFYVFNENETAYYNIAAGITTNVSDANLVVTVTDVATGADDIAAQSFDVATGSSYATQTFKLSNAITPGLKLITLGFTKDDETTSNWLYNIKNITFYKRSLNDSYNYTPVAATGVDVVLTRSITADKWSTICLPFSMTADQVTTAFGSGVKLASIGSYNSGNKQITTAEATTITANEPCFIKVASNFTSATINGVTIEAGTPEKTISGDFKLVGTYTAGTIASGNYFVSNNQLYKSTGTSHIKPFRAYFTSVPAGARIMFFDDEETTAINEAKSQELKANGQYFDLQGRKVAQPTRGLYIVNGKKVIIK